MKISKVQNLTNNQTIKKITKNIGEKSSIKSKITPRKLPNSIGAVDEYYGATWIVSQEQLEKIKEIWGKVPKSLKDAIRSFN